MELIEEYIKKPREERRAHLKLDDPCYSRGGQSMYNKGLLAYLHNTTMPKGHVAQVCHACHNGWCDNPHHLYWGTPSDNHRDYMENGGTSITERVRNKYTTEEISRMNSRANIKGNIAQGKIKPL